MTQIMVQDLGHIPDPSPNMEIIGVATSGLVTGFRSAGVMVIARSLGAADDLLDTLIAAIAISGVSGRHSWGLAPRGYPARAGTVPQCSAVRSSKRGSSMTDSRLRGRVKGLFAGAPGENELMEPVPTQGLGEHDSDAERQALQVLVLARRTADDHISTAQQDAHKIRTDAQGRAEDFIREAQAMADGVRRDADKVLSDARAHADQMSREAQAAAEGARREADRILQEARGKAEQIAKDAQNRADQLEQDAEQRYQEVVGTLETKSAALQQQISALQQFNRDYRGRLAQFMQSQLRALGVDEMPEAPDFEAHDGQEQEADVPAPKKARAVKA
jgi:cell division septum initiation protein DivIVA